MSEPQEIELKLALINEADYSSIIIDQHLFSSIQVGKSRIDNYTNTYFDTADRDLYQNQLSFRVRKTAKGYNATIKGLGAQQGGLSIRREWNVSIPDDKPHIEAFAQVMDEPEYNKLAGIIGNRDLLPIFTSDFQRMTADLHNDNGSQVELAVDKGQITTGDGSLPICEVELELMKGQPADLLKLGAQLAARYPLRVEEKSKFARGLELLGIPISESATLSKFDKDSPVGEVMLAMFTYYLQQILAGQDVLTAAPDDPESIHQIRVRIRQLRSLLSFFKPLLDQEEYNQVMARLGEMSGQLGPIREMDVLLSEWQSLQLSYPNILAGSRSLEQLLKAERAKELNPVYQHISAGGNTPELLRVWSFFEERSWLQHPDSNKPLKQFMDQRLKKWVRNIDKTLRTVDYNDILVLHPLRIRTKKLRYAVQALEPVLGRKYRALLPELKELQDKLGTICDAHGEATLIQKLGKGKRSNTLQLQSGMLMGFLLCRAANIARDLQDQTQS